MIEEGGADKLTRILPRMPDRQVAHLITSLSLIQRSAYIERGIDTHLTKAACERLDNMVQWALEKGMELEGTQGEEEFFDDGCQDNHLRLKSYQQAQARLSTGAGGLGLASAALRRFSASLGNLVSTLPAVVASLTGPLGEAMKERIPETVLVNRMGEAIKELNQEHGLSEEVLRMMVPPSWVSWALEQPRENGRRSPTIGELAAHDGESTTPRKDQHKLGRAMNSVQIERFMESLEALPVEEVPPTPNDPFGGEESRDMAKARVRSSQGKGAHAWLRATPTDRAPEIPANEFTLALRRAVGGWRNS